MKPISKLDCYGSKLGGLLFYVGWLSVGWLLHVTLCIVPHAVVHKVWISKV